jgi:hypothetical protein
MARMTRSPTRPLLAALLALPLALSSVPARAQEVPGPDAPLPPSAQPLPPPVQPAPPSSPPPPAPPPPYEAPQAAWIPPDQERTPPSNWYGWQTLVASVPIDIAMFVGLAHYADPSGANAFAVAFAARNLVPAVVHFSHGRPSRGFGSVGLMAASAATGVAIGYAVGLAAQSTCGPGAQCRNGFRSIPPAAGYGGIAGSMAGTLLDVVFFAHRQRLTWTAAKNEPSWNLSPQVTPRSAGLVAGLTL